MTTEEIAQRIETIPADLTGSAWGFAFLSCFQGKDSILPKSTFDRVEQGSSNFADDKETEILWKKRIYFQWVEKDIRSALTDAKSSSVLLRPANKPIFILIASPNEIAAHDLDQGEDLVIPRYELPSFTYFFLPFVGKKKVTVTSEALEVDVRATRKMAVLFDEIRKDNPGFDTHDLNVFLARLLFCFYAEDTGIFKDGLFTSSIASHTSDDGSDLAEYLSTLFRRFATEDDRSFRREFRDFKYVNGGLFENPHPVPTFSKISRKTLLENGKMHWRAINPDIFGSMFQSIIDPEKRHELGMHYTTRENIMKVISPLFLDGLREDFEKTKDSPKKLEAFHQRLAEIRIFDPACGSGNFLILAYEKLRELEMDVLEAKKQVAELFPRIRLNHFHGIEIDDFAQSLAMLALWIKEHQMNLVFHGRFNTSPAALPLREGGKIAKDNATRCDWETVCPRTKSDRDGATQHLEIYVLGNPPYLGSSLQDPQQKEDLELLGESEGIEGYKNLDYISCWFFKAAAYLRGHHIAAAFVSTNSISQGEQTALIWRSIVENTGVEIFFAYESFKWKNSAAGNAGVTCIIVGLRNVSDGQKWIINGTVTATVPFINAYLRNLPEVWVYRQPTSLSGLPEMVFGNKPVENGHLLLDATERETLLAECPEAMKFLKNYLGAEEFLHKQPRYCLWVSDEDYSEARKLNPLRERFDMVSRWRKTSNKKQTVEFADRPYRFVERRHRDTESIIFPSVTSETREYIPLGFLDANTVISNLGYAIYDAQPWVFGVLSSKMHMEWTKLVAGRLETRVRYSSFVYNNFPIPPISTKTKEALEEAVFEIIDVREEFHEMTYAEMHDKMPDKLLQAHRKLDGIVDRCYRDKPFKDVDDRLKHLIALYKQMTRQN